MSYISKGLFWGATLFYPLVICVRAFAVVLKPVLQALGFAVDVYKHIVSSVAILHRSCRPAAVTRLVVAIYINAVNRVFAVRSFANISQEVLKLLPAVANRDTSTSIVLVRRFGWPGAAGSHGKPASVGGVHVLGSTHAVGGVQFDTVAATGLGVSGLEVFGDNNLPVPTATGAEPLNSAVCPSGYGRDTGKAGKGFPVEVFCSGKCFDWCKMHLSHIGTRFINVVRGLPVVAGSAPNYTTMPSNSWRFV